MKLLVRFMGLGLIGIVLIAMMFEMVSLNIREDELNTIVSMAISNTQLVMQEIIEDELYQTTNARMILDDEKYFELFMDNLDTLISTDSVYEVRLLAIDHTKGLIDVEVDLKYRGIDGSLKVLSTRKTSIVDVLME